MLSLVGALLSAGTYMPDDAVAATRPVPRQAVADIRRARVELYCGNDAQAVETIRAARSRLGDRAGVPTARARAVLDKASWLARHGRFQDAVQALDHALASLDPHDALA